jgi:hypothetical protein
MANVFKNSVTGSIGTSGVKVYETPSLTTSTIIGLNIANAVSNNISVSAMVRDNTGNKTAYLVKDAIVVAGSTTVLFGGEQKLVLKSGDFLSVTSSLANSADIIVSVLELT